MKGSTVSVAALKPVGLEYETIFDSSRCWRTCAGCGRADAIRINLASASRLNNFG